MLNPFEIARQIARISFYLYTARYLHVNMYRYIPWYAHQVDQISQVLLPYTGPAIHAVNEAVMNTTIYAATRVDPRIGTLVAFQLRPVVLTDDSYAKTVALITLCMYASIPCAENDKIKIERKELAANTVNQIFKLYDTSNIDYLQLSQTLSETMYAGEASLSTLAALANFIKDDVQKDDLFWKHFFTFHQNFRQAGYGFWRTNFFDKALEDANECGNSMLHPKVKRIISSCGAGIFAKGASMLDKDMKECGKITGSTMKLMKLMLKQHILSLGHTQQRSRLRITP